jgi:hypothetical protein
MLLRQFSADMRIACAYATEQALPAVALCWVESVIAFMAQLGATSNQLSNISPSLPSPGDMQLHRHLGSEAWGSRCDQGWGPEPCLHDICIASTGVRGVAEGRNFAGKLLGGCGNQSGNVKAVMGNSACRRNGWSWECGLQAEANSIVSAVDSYPKRAMSIQGRCGGLGYRCDRRPVPFWA